MTHAASHRLLALALALHAGACGYVGFEPRPLADGSVGEAGLDDLDGGQDAAIALEAGSAEDADLDATLDDAEVPSDARAEAGIETQVSDYCGELPALLREPAIDGQLDGRLRLLPLTPQGWTGNLAVPDHTRAQFALGYRPDGLYVFVRVEDPNRLPPLDQDEVWFGDGVEVYVDDDGNYDAPDVYDDPGTIQLVVAAPGDAQNPGMRAERFRDTLSVSGPSGVSFASFPTPNGYVLEAFLSAAALDLPSWSLAPGAHIGLNLSINVSPLDHQLEPDAGIALEGYRMGQYFLRVGGDSCGGLPYCTPSAFCRPVLIR